MMLIENKIIQTTEDGFLKELIEISSQYNALKVDIDGAEIQTWKDFIRSIEKSFQFPTTCEDSMDRYLDWIRDLSWLENEAFIILVKNSKEFFVNNSKLRDEILNDLEEVVLPFWESEVEEVVVDGKSKLFRVYLI
ncbi:barstar family protein [Anaerotignum propionicum]|uniref:barstar family protein n=1 Tax=Anaerotignum propionicum TaxID=28446 RepID=UPI00289DC2CA|nr:barstar family protein [Anaerotignum propionicum]